MGGRYRLGRLAVVVAGLALAYFGLMALLEYHRRDLSASHVELIRVAGIVLVILAFRGLQRWAQEPKDQPPESEPP